MRTVRESATTSDTHGEQAVVKQVTRDCAWFGKPAASGVWGTAPEGRVIGAQPLSSF